MINTILQGHVIDKLREIESESIDCCITSPLFPRNRLMRRVITTIIQATDFISKKFSKGYCFFTNCISCKGNILTPSGFMIRNLFKIFGLFQGLSKFQENFRLSFFNSQVWVDCLDKFMGFLIHQLNAVQWLAIFSIWFLNIFISSKQLMNQLNGLRLNLFQSYPFRICAILGVFKFTDIIATSLNSEISITIHNTSYISKSNFIHGVLYTAKEVM